MVAAKVKIPRQHQVKAGLALCRQVNMNFPREFIEGLFLLTAKGRRK
jgi:hypothetical protein